MSKAQTLKSIIKKGVSEKPSFGTNPWDPWSAKANIAEDAALDQYLTSRGINPKHVTKDQKVAHSKMGQFLKWKRDHMVESLVEAIDRMDVVMFDIPLLIRMLEYAREDAKTDMDLHKVVEKLINIRKKGVLTMKDYNFVTRLKEDLDLDESHVAIAMGQMMDDEGSMVLNQLDQMERAVKMVRDHIGTDYEKQLPAWVQSKLTLATDYIDTVGNYLSSKNEDVNEAASASIRMYKALQQAKEKREREERLGNELLNKKPPEQKPVQKEEIEQIDEISTKGYHSAAIKSRNDAAVKVIASMGTDKQARTKLDARNAGLKRLSDRTHADMKKANSGPQKPVEHKPSSMSSPQAYYASKKPGEYTGDSVEHPEDTNVISETKSVTEVAPPGFEGTVKAMKKYKKIDNPWALAWSMKNKGYKSHKKVDGTPKNENYQDPMAASSMPGDCANSPDDVQPKDKNKKLIQMSKSARIIKNLYKKKGMKEETYDHEKEDKSVATYGKKPKMQQVSTGLEEPKAAAVLTGGTTMTGEKRDTIEIDPMMKMRKPISGKR